MRSEKNFWSAGILIALTVCSPVAPQQKQQPLTPVEKLAAALVAAKSEEERAAILAEKRELATPELPLEIMRQASRLSMQGNYPQALTGYRLARDVAERIGDQAGVARALSNIGSVHRVLGDYSEALRHFQQSLSLQETWHDSAGMAQTLTSIGAVNYDQGNLVQALDYFQQSLELREKLKDPMGLAFTFGGIGLVRYALGDYARALEAYQKSLTLREAQGEKSSIALAWNAIAAVYLRQADYPQVMAHARKALALSEAVGGGIPAAQALNQLGRAYLGQGQYPEALDHFRKSLALREKLGEKKGIATVLNSIGNLYRLQGDHAQALDYFEKSLALRQALGDQEGAAETWNEIGLVEYGQSHHAPALDRAEQAASLARRINSREKLWAALTTQGLAYRGLKDPGKEKDALEEAIGIIESLRGQVAGGEQEQQFSFEGKLVPYHSMVELLLAENRAADALSYAERAKARVLLDVLRSGRRNITKSMTAEEQEGERKRTAELVSLNAQIARQSQSVPPDENRLAGLRARLQASRLEMEAFQDRLYAAHPELRIQRGEAHPLTVEGAAGLVPAAKGALLEYVVTEDRTYMLALTREEGLRGYTLNVRRKDLSDKVRRFRTRLANRDLAFRELAGELYALLVRPAQAELAGKKTLVIVPDGILWELPFQALRSPAGRFLIEDYAVSYSPSLTVLREMQRVRRAGAQAALLAVGNPAANLPESERQVKMLGQLYGPANSKIYTGAQAREDIWKAEAGKYRILHLATHAILDDQSPMYSHLLFSPSGTSGQDGLLEAWEIMNLELHADLAVLSACETARGRLGAGEGVIGLTWALFVAGVPTTVVSQWKVESSSTTELMVEFHRHLRRGHTTKAEALRKAALALLQSPPYRHPFFWAGFIVVGDGS